MRFTHPASAQPGAMYSAPGCPVQRPVDSRVKKESNQWRQALNVKTVDILRQRQSHASPWTLHFHLSCCCMLVSMCVTGDECSLLLPTVSRRSRQLGNGYEHYVGEAREGRNDPKADAYRYLSLHECYTTDMASKALPCVTTNRYLFPQFAPPLTNPLP